MSQLPRVVSVEPLGDLRLRLTFSDGLVRELDLGGMVEGKLFEPMRDRATFAQVSIDPVTRTIAWPNGVDLDPDVLHGDHEPTDGRSADYERLGLSPTSIAPCEDGARTDDSAGTYEWWYFDAHLPTRPSW